MVVAERQIVKENMRRKDKGDRVCGLQAAICFYIILSYFLSPAPINARFQQTSKAFLNSNLLPCDFPSICPCVEVTCCTMSFTSLHNNNMTFPSQST